MGEGGINDSPVLVTNRRRVDFFAFFSVLVGKYVYIETSSPRKPGENAKLVVMVPKNGKEACLSFYYHMYGATVGTLNVYSGSTKLVNISGDQGNYWKMMERNIYLDSTVSHNPCPLTLTVDSHAKGLKL